jgi:hypothetical protein
MTRIKHIVKQAILENNSLNVRFKLVKTIRMKSTKEKRFIRKTRSLLKNVDRKTRRYKFENIYASRHAIIIIFILISFDSDDFERNTSISEELKSSRVEIVDATINERNSARNIHRYTFSKSRRRCFTKDDRNNAC